MNLRKKSFFIIGIIVFFVISIQPSYAFKFNIDNPRITLEMNPGEKSIGYITVDNYGFNQDLKVRVYVNDIVYLPDGTNDFLPEGSTKWSLVDWIKIEPKEFILKGNTAEIVRYVIRAPADAKGGRYGVIFFEADTSSFPDRFSPPTTSAIRLGSVVDVTVRDTGEYEASLLGLETHFEEGNKLVARCIIRNSGNILIRPEGEFVIIDREGFEIAKENINPKRGGILPDTSRVFMSEWWKDQIEWKEDKNYILQVTVDYGGESLLGGQTYFEIDE